ncbi:hypothetical protein IW262DRAFT_1463443 [Armillaria fumosa]|nr:hypothetical protein IW262DRAFT_1463443 [Armillaria fumosa]
MPPVPKLSSPLSPIPATPAVSTAGLAPPTIKKVILPPVALLLSPHHTGAQSSTSSPLRVPPTSATGFSLVSQASATPTCPNLANLMESHLATPPTNFNELAHQMAETVCIDSPMPILTTPRHKPSSFNLFPSARPSQASGSHRLSSQTLWFNPTLQLPLLMPHCQASPLPLVVGQSDFNPTPVPLVPINEPVPDSMMVDEPTPEPMPVNKPALPSLPRMYHTLSGEPLDLSELSAHPSAPIPTTDKQSSSQQQPATTASTKPKPRRLLKDRRRMLESACSSPPVLLVSSACLKPAPGSTKTSNKRKHSSSKTKPPQLMLASSLVDEPCTRACAYASKAVILPSPVNVKSEPNSKEVRVTKKPKLSSFNKKGSKAAGSSHPCKKSRFLTKAPGSGSDSKTSGVAITHQTTCAELKTLTFDDIWAAPYKFLQPVHYPGKNGTFGAHSSANPWFVQAPDHYAESCIPCTSKSIKCTWTNKFPGAVCDQCTSSHHGQCSAHYMAQEMNTISTRIAPFSKYNIGNLEWDLAQLCNINHKLEHLDYLVHSCYLAHDIIIQKIAEALDQLSSHENGNQIVESLTAAYGEVNSFIVNNGICQSLGQPFDVPHGPMATFDDADSTMWELSNNEGLCQAQEACQRSNQTNNEEDLQEGSSNSLEDGLDGEGVDSQAEA